MIEENTQYIFSALHKTATVFFFRQLLPDMFNTKPYRQHTLPGDDRPLKVRRFFYHEAKEGVIYAYVLRNPLDILVSEYYSFGWTHKLNNDSLRENRPIFQSMTADEYCMTRCTETEYRISTLPAPQSDCYFLTYEEMVLDWPQWCPKFCAPFGTPQEKVTELVEKYKTEFEVTELTPEEIFAGEKRHKRKVTPMDHKYKLKPETIEFLNEVFKDFLAFLNSLYPKHILTQLEDL